MNKYRASLLIAVLVLCGALLAQPVWAQGRAVLGWVVANRATIQDGGLTVTGDSTLADTTIGGALSADTVTVDTLLTLAAADVITVTNGATLTPLGSVQPIASAGAVGFGAIAAGTAGQLLIIENTVNQTITITDSTTLRLGGNAALGQYDTLTLVYDGATWVQLAKTDN